MNRNPFRWSNSLHKDNDPSCILRKESLDKVIELVRQGTYVQVLAPAQYGRTTFAFQLIDELVHTKSGMYPLLPVLIRCLHIQGGDFQAVQMAITDALLKVAKEFLPQDQYRSIATMLLKKNLTASIYGFQKFLVEIEKNTDQCDFVFIFDDLETLDSEVIGKTLSLLRSLYEHYSEDRHRIPYRVVILSSRDLTMESPLALSPFNVSDLVQLLPFSRTELDIMLGDTHTGRLLEGIRFNSKARDQIMQESGGHPYLIQRICGIMIEEARHSDKELTETNIVYGCILLLEEGDRNLSRLNTITDNQEEWRLCKRLIKGENVPFRAVQREISSLKARGIISKEKGFCRIPVKLYKRCLISFCFNEEFSEKNYVTGFKNWQQVLLSFPPVQQILLNSELNRMVRSRKGDKVFQDEFKAGANSYNRVKFVDNEIKSIDLEELNVFLTYYGCEKLNSSTPVSLMINQWLSQISQESQRGKS